MSIFRGRQGDVAAALIIIVAVALAFFDVLSSERVLSFRDHSQVFRPALWAAVEQVRQGTWPVVPTGAGSLPLESATALALYTPATLIFLALPFDDAYDLFVLGHVAWLCLGCYVYARSHGRAPPSALVTALACGLAGPCLSFENLVVGLQCMAWAPWVSLLALRVLESRSTGAWASFVLATAFELQAALPEVVLLQLAVFAVAAYRRRPTYEGWAWLVLGGMLSLGVAAVELGPLVEALAASRRGGGFALDERSGWALSLMGLLELLWPAFFAPPELVAVHVPTSGATAGAPPYLLSLYLGCAAAIALTARVRTRTLVWAGLGFAVVLSFGSATPLYGWVTSLPVLSSSRYAIKYMVAVVALVAWLAGDAIQERRVSILVRVAAVYFLVALSAAWTVASDDFVPWLSGVLRPLSGGAAFEVFRTGDPAVLVQAAMQARAIHVVVSAGALLLVAVVLATRPFALAPWALGLVVALDLAGAARFSVLGASRVSLEPPTALMDALRSARRTFVSLPPPIPVAAEGSLFEAYAATRGRYGLTEFRGVRRYDPADLDGLTPALETRAFERLSQVPWPSARRVLVRAGVDQITSLSDRPELPRGREVPELGLSVYRLPEARPYVWTSTAVAWVTDEDAALTALAMLPAGVVVAIGAEPERSTGACPQAQLEVSQRPWQASARGVSPCPYMLVLQEVLVPGWRATVDGVEVKPMVVEAGHIGVWVPSGQHEASIVYVPRSRRWAKVSLGAAVVMLLAVLARARRAWGRRQ